MPLLISGRTGFRQGLMHTHRLHAVVLAILPLQVFAIHEVAQAGVKGRDVVVLQIHFNEVFPALWVVVDLDAIQQIVGEVQILQHAQLPQVLGDIARAAEQQTIPVLQWGFRQIEARIAREMRRTQ